MKFVYFNDRDVQSFTKIVRFVFLVQPLQSEKQTNCEYLKW